MRISQNLVEEEVRKKTPNPLTRRQLLSQVASLYDPIGLATPAKQKGAILVRKAFQEAGGKTLTRDTWDRPLSERLREEAIHLFEEYTRLNQITFHRSLTPVKRIGKPWGITFSDGSDQSYGAVAYFRWETEQGILVRLVESKAKLTPLDQKGEPVKAEVCGAVFAARLRKYIEKHSRMQVERWLHLLDSQTVLGAIQRDSYGYQTFFANRVGEIQKSTSVEDWRWIPGEQNIADLTTRGATPEDLKETSVWQRGGRFCNPRSGKCLTTSQQEEQPQKTSKRPLCGKEEVDSAIQEAENACDIAQASPITAINRDGYELQLERARKLIHDATVSLKDWERWIPHDQTAHLKGRLKDLRTFGSNLEARRAEFITAQKIAEEERRGPETQQTAVPQPVVRIKPTSLPKFTGFRRNFHRWLRDWGSLQKQGEPTGSVEVKKFQLLDSVDERICRDLRLSTYNSAEDIFRVLQNRYGNKTTIALEIIEDLERIPPLKSHQPRKVIDLIQAVEKALNDLTELESTGAIKNPLVIRSIESKLPDNMKRDWLTFMVNPRNGVTPDNHFDILLTFLKTQEDILEKLDQLGVGEKPEKKAMYLEKKYATTKSTRIGG